MNKVYPKTVDLAEIKDYEKKFLKSLKKVKIKKIVCGEPEVFEIGSVKLIKIKNSLLEDFSNADVKKEDVDLRNVNDLLKDTKTIKEILATDISTPIAELLNIDVTEHIQNAIENIVNMVSVNKNS